MSTLSISFDVNVEGFHRALAKSTLRCSFDWMYTSICSITARYPFYRIRSHQIPQQTWIFNSPSLRRSGHRYRSWGVADPNRNKQKLLPPKGCSMFIHSLFSLPITENKFPFGWLLSKGIRASCQHKIRRACRNTYILPFQVDVACDSTQQLSIQRFSPIIRAWLPLSLSLSLSLRSVWPAFSCLRQSLQSNCGWRCEKWKMVRFWPEPKLRATHFLSSDTMSWVGCAHEYAKICHDTIDQFKSNRIRKSTYDPNSIWNFQIKTKLIRLKWEKGRQNKIYTVFIASKQNVPKRINLNANMLWHRPPELSDRFVPILFYFFFTFVIINGPFMSHANYLSTFRRRFNVNVASSCVSMPRGFDWCPYNGASHARNIHPASTFSWENKMQSIFIFFIDVCPYFRPHRLRRPPLSMEKYEVLFGSFNGEKNRQA